MQPEPSQKVSAENLGTFTNPVTQKCPFSDLLHHGCLAIYPHGILQAGASWLQPMLQKFGCC